MVNLDPPPPPRSVGEVLGTGQLPDNLVAALSDRFRVTKEDDRPLSPEKRYGRGVHYFLANLASRVDPVPGFDRVGLLQVNPDGMVHILHSMFSVPVDLYPSARRLFAYWGELPLEGLPPVVEFPVDAFLVRHSVRAVPREDCISHLEGVSPYAWQATPCKRVGEGGRGWTQPSLPRDHLRHPGRRLPPAQHLLKYCGGGPVAVPYLGRSGASF